MFLTDKFCYITIPKNASRSILSKLNDINIERINTDESQFLSYWYNKKEIPFSFTFTRNPYNRALTSYRHAIKEEWINKTMTFTNYLKLLKCIYIDCDLVNKNDIFKDENIKLTIRDKISKKTNLHLPLYDEHIYNIQMILDHSFPQYKYIVNNDEKIIVDFIGKIENFNEIINNDWNKLCSIFKTKLNLNLDNKLPLLNERPTFISYDYENRRFGYLYKKNDEYDNDVRKLIYKIYKKDFELLNYNKDKLVQCKKNINFKLEKKLNDDFFDLYEIMNKNPQSEKISQMIEELFKYILECIKKKDTEIIINERIKYLKTIINNSEKIRFILSQLCGSLHILPKYIE